MRIQEFADLYYAMPEDQRNIDEWVPVLEGFIVSMCRKYRNVGDWEDRYQTAWVGATKAIQKFSPERTKGQFSSFLWMVLDNEMKMMYRKINNDKKKAEGVIIKSLDDNFKGYGGSDTEKLTYGDMITEDTDDFSKIIADDLYESLYEVCSPNQKLILEASYKKHLRKSDIAEHCGKTWTQSYITNSFVAIRKKYKNLMGDLLD